VVEVTVTLLVCNPAEVSVIFTDNMHVAPVASAAADRLTEVLPGVAVAVPLQVVVKPLDDDTTIPSGKLSVKATPARATVLAAGLVRVNVREVDPFSGILAAPNTLAMVGGAATYKVAEAVPPVPPSFEAMVLVTLFLVPAVVPTTFTVILQSVSAATVPPDRLTKPLFGVATAEPPQPSKISLGEATTTPYGRVSEKARPLRPDELFWFTTTNVNWAVLLSGMVYGPTSPRGRADGFRVRAAGGSDTSPNDFEKNGGDTTVRLAVEVLPVPALAEVTVTLLFFTPEEMPVTFTDSEHEALEASVTPDKVTELPPGGAADVPPQLVLRSVVDDTTNPAGRVSVKATPVIGSGLPAGLVIVNDKVVDPLSGILFAPNALAMVGGSSTDK